MTFHFCSVHVYIIDWMCVLLIFVILLLYFCLFIVVPQVGPFSLMWHFLVLFISHLKRVWILYQPFSGNSINVPFDTCQGSQNYLYALE